MSDRRRLVEIWRWRHLGALAASVAASAVVIAAMAGVVLLLLLIGIHILDWLGVLPCLCG